MRYYGLMYRLLKCEDGSMEYAEGVGDRSIVRLDGRWGMDRMKAEAAQWAARHGYDGFRIARGDNLLDLFMLTAAVIPTSKYM